MEYDEKINFDLIMGCLVGCKSLEVRWGDLVWQMCDGVQTSSEVNGVFVQSWRFEVDSGQGTVDSAEIPTPLACFITHSDRLRMS
jgi:hypothetical protein